MNGAEATTKAWKFDSGHTFNYAQYGHIKGRDATIRAQTESLHERVTLKATIELFTKTTEGKRKQKMRAEWRNNRAGIRRQ